VDVVSSVDTILLSYIERTVTDAKEKLIEAVKHRYRSLDDVGTPLKFSDEAALERTISEFNDLGIEEVGNYVNSKKTYILCIFSSFLLLLMLIVCIYSDSQKIVDYWHQHRFIRQNLAAFL